MINPINSYLIIPPLIFLISLCSGGQRGKSKAKLLMAKVRLNCPTCFELANQSSHDDSYKNNDIHFHLNYNIMILIRVFKGDLKLIGDLRRSIGFGNSCLF